MSTYKTELAAFGQAVREMREQQGITTANLAAAVGMSQERLEALEDGRYNVPFKLLLRIPEALHVPPAVLMGQAEPVDTAAICAAFGQRLRELREQRGISQEALARYAGVHRTAVSKFDRGLTDPRLTTIIRLARGLGVPPNRLVDRLVADV